MKDFYRKRVQHASEQLSDRVFEGDNSFKNFTRMSTVDFELLLSMVAPLIKNNDTNFRSAIPARERLLITLRYLASADSYVSLQYLFRISKQSISKIIPQTTDAIIQVLKHYICQGKKKKEKGNDGHLECNMAIARYFEKKQKN